MDRTTFQISLMQHQAQLKHMALRLTGNDFDADDLFQDTILKTLYHYESFKPGTNLKAWAYTIMKNIFLNECKRKKIKPTSNHPYLENIENNVSDNTGNTSDSIFSHKEIHQIIGRLEQASRDTFSLFLNGYKYKEIAEQLHIPVGTVKSRVFEARKKISHFLN